MVKPISNKWRDRFHLSIGAQWFLFPDKGDGWLQWAFSPFGGVTLPGQILDNARAQLPDIRGFVDELGDGEIDPATQLRNYRWVSRTFWLRFGCRVLGLDLGVSLWWRRRDRETQP